MEKEIQNIEKSTRGESDSNTWKEYCKGQLTASKHHALYFKNNTISKVKLHTLQNYTTCLQYNISRWQIEKPLPGKMGAR